MFEGDAVVVVLYQTEVGHDQVKQLLAGVGRLTDDVQLGAVQQHHLQTAQAGGTSILEAGVKLC